MISKKARAKSKVSLSRYFKELENGDSVAIVKEKSLDFEVPKRLQGRTGVVEGRRGGAYIISVKDQNKEKKFVVSPIHLKKINS